MLGKRIIPCLDVKDGRVVKGINFVNFVDVEDPVLAAKCYSDSKADEVVFLDITATSDNRKTIVDVVKKAAKEISIPFTVGGGIRSVEDMREILSAGANKVSINSAAVKNPDLINEAAKEFGKNCVVLAIDAKYEDGHYAVYINGGNTKTSLDVVMWAKEGEKRGAAEILLTSMDKDGTKSGYDVELTKSVVQAVNIPVIASGGAGKKEDFKEILQYADGALAASLFHFKEIEIKELKDYLESNNILVRR